MTRIRENRGVDRKWERNGMKSEDEISIKKKARRKMEEKAK